MTFSINYIAWVNDDTECRSSLNRGSIEEIDLIMLMLVTYFALYADHDRSKESLYSIFSST